MVLFEVNLAPRKKKPQCKIYIRKGADTTRIKKELLTYFNFQGHEFCILEIHGVNLNSLLHP